MRQSLFLTENPYISCNGARFYCYNNIHKDKFSKKREWTPKQ